jgi:hypothetical protein
MAKQQDERYAGVSISGNARVDVKGDIVGRDKIQNVSADTSLDAVFDELNRAIDSTKGLSTDQRRRLAAASADLKSELGSDKPDLGKVERLKTMLASMGGQIASATSAIFVYQPVQETLKVAVQRLLGA